MEHVYYYRLRQLRMAACQSLHEAQPVQLAEVPLAPKEPEHHASLRLTTVAGTLECPIRFNGLPVSDERCGQFG